MDSSWILAPSTGQIFMIFFVLCIIISSIWGWILIALLMLFYYLFRSRTQTAKPSKTNVLKMNLNDLTIHIQEQIVLIFSYMFSVTSFAISFLWVLAPILIPFWHPFDIEFNVLRWLIVWWFIESTLSTFDQEWFPTAIVGPHLFLICSLHLFSHTPSFYLCKTNRCQKPFYPICSRR